MAKCWFVPQQPAVCAWPGRCSAWAGNVHRCTSIRICATWATCSAHARAAPPNSQVSLPIVRRLS